MDMQYVKLNNGIEMPQVGLGTFLIPKDKLEDTLITAYDMGYRQFDTAWRYYNEADIARIFKKHGIKREDVFITTKVNIDAFYYGGYKYGIHRILNRRNNVSIEQAILKSFDNLDTEYIDLFLIHNPWKIFMDMWEVLEKFYKEGRIRAIGVSNFLQPHIEALSEISDVVPAVNQIEISPLNAQIELTKYCQDRGIAVEAMSSFSHFRSVEPRLEIIEHPLILAIAKKHGKSTVQVVLRWLVQRGIIVIPKTWNMVHLKENISILDFELSVDEMAEITSLNKGRYLNYNPFVAQRGLPKKYRNWEGFKNPDNFTDMFNNFPAWRKWLSIY